MTARSTVPFTPEAMRAEKRLVARHSVWAALGITGLKFFVGATTGSLGILSEALHSSLDLVAAVITLLSVRVSDKPADAEHQYGHGKVENLSAFFETGLLLLTCAWIITEAVSRLLYKSVDVEPSVPAFGIMLLAMGVDWWRSRALNRIARKYDSPALAADALHFSIDVWSSLVVILGLVAVLVGRRYGVARLRNADPVAALVVAGVVVYVSSRLARQTIDALLDAAPRGVRSTVLATVRAVPGVLEIDRVRIRRAGTRYFVDLSVGLSRSVTFQRADQVVETVVDAVHAIVPDSDVVVHCTPRVAQEENVFDRVRAVAARNNFNVHDVSVQNFNGRLHVEQHLELNERLTLKDAHDEVTRLEAEVRTEVPDIASILTHIESEPATVETGEAVVQDPDLEARLRGIGKSFPDVLDMHDLRLKRVRGHLYLSCHCSMPDSLPLTRVHEVQTALEIRFKQEAPELFRVLIHPEPQTDNLR